jgi:glycosyltransferase involved in cell wall biosynthesis
LRGLLHELRPALVHLNDSVLLASAIMAHKAGVPVIWHLRSSLANDGRDRRSRWIQRTMDRCGVAAIAIDEDVASSFSFLRMPVHLIHNPVLVESGEPLALQIPTDRTRVGYVGYLRRQKGWPELLEALRLLLDEGVAVHGVFVGGAIRKATAFRGWRGRLLKAAGVPDEQSAFEERVHDLRLTENISLLPFMPHVGGLYRSLDIVVFPNQGAGLGRPVLEAAAYGLPAIAGGSRAGGGVLVPGETGLLLHERDSASFAAAIGSLARDPSLRRQFGAAAALHAGAWRPERSARDVETVYERALRPG